MPRSHVCPAQAFLDSRAARLAAREAARSAVPPLYKLAGKVCGFIWSWPKSKDRLSWFLHLGRIMTRRLSQPRPSVRRPPLCFTQVARAVLLERVEHLGRVALQKRERELERAVGVVGGGAMPAKVSVQKI